MILDISNMENWIIFDEISMDGKYFIVMNMK